VAGKYSAHVNGSDNDESVMWTLSAAGKWTDQILPLPADATPGSGEFNDLDNVISCGGTQCAAIGAYVRNNAQYNGAVLWTLTGTTWTATEAALPADAASSSFPQADAVACEPSGTCAATGTYSGHSSVGQGALWTWTGSTWTVSPAPGPADASDGFSNAHPPLSCGTGGVCAGALQTNVPNPDELWLLSGGQWAHVALPMPAGADTSKHIGISAVSCTSGGLCTAAGQYTDSNGNQQASLWARSSSGSWTATKAQLPANASANPTAGVKFMSCGGNGICLASGPYIAHINGSDLPENAMWAYSAGTWSLVPALVAHQESVTTLACNTNYCVAHIDGFDSTTQESFASRIWTLFGGIWHTATLPLPPNAKVGLTDDYRLASQSYAGGLLSTDYSDPNSNNRDAAWVFIS